MKILKRILLGVLALIVLVLIVALFMPAEYTVTRSAEINRPKQEVFDYVKSLKNQEQYSVWVMEDPKIQMTYTGEDGTVGASSAWVSEKMGEGSQTITSITDNTINVDLNFIKPMKDEAKASMVVDEVDANKSKITCTFYGKAPHYKNKLFSMMGRYFVGDAYEKNLANVKKNLEK